MDAISYVVNQINRTIPKEILYEGMLIDEPREVAHLTSIDDKIYRKIIQKRVLLDSNVVGGIETTIPISALALVETNINYTIYHASNDTTMNKEIVSALSISPIMGNGSGVNYVPGGGFGYGGYSYGVGDRVYPQNNQNPLANVGARISNSIYPQGPHFNTHLELVGYNTILIMMPSRLLGSCAMRVVLENDSRLNNISPRSYQDLAKLCTLATKSYLFNKLAIPVNAGYLSGGQELGMFKSILDEYSASEEEYQTFLTEVWSKVLFMNDPTRHSRYLHSLTAPDI